MTAMPHLAAIDWDALDRMQHADLGGGGDVYFQYDAAGNRVRKIRVNTAGTQTEERIYLGALELYRERTSGTLQLERETLHVADDTARICMIETRTVNSGSPVTSPANDARYQYSNHLGTVSLELDAAANTINYEEYHPYGTSAYRAVDSTIEVSAKRYRYTGLERDEETGLDLMGARYYASWLGRWTAADPIGLGDEENRYAYVRGNAVGLQDPHGTRAEPSEQEKAARGQAERMDKEIAEAGGSGTQLYPTKATEELRLAKEAARGLRERGLSGPVVAAIERTRIREGSYKGARGVTNAEAITLPRETINDLTTDRKMPQVYASEIDFLTQDPISTLVHEGVHALLIQGNRELEAAIIELSAHVKGRTVAMDAGYVTLAELEALLYAEEAIGQVAGRLAVLRANTEARLAEPDADREAVKQAYFDAKIALATSSVGFHSMWGDDGVLQTAELEGEPLHPSMRLIDYIERDLLGYQVLFESKDDVRTPK